MKRTRIYPRLGPKGLNLCASLDQAVESVQCMFRFKCCIDKLELQDRRKAKLNLFNTSTRMIRAQAARLHTWRVLLFATATYALF